MDRLIKRHVIKVKQKQNGKLSEKINESLGNLLGVREVNTDDNTGRIRIVYNLEFVSYSFLEDKLEKMGLKPKTGFYRKLKRSFIDFTEKNERQNLNGPGI